MKKTVLLFFVLMAFYFGFAQSTGFDGYTGAGTEPAGWVIANAGTTAANSSYTSAGNFGVSSPSVRLDVTGESITTPTFTSPLTLQFWGKGQSISGAGAILVEQFVGGSWTTMVNLTFTGGTLFNVITTYGPYTLDNTATQARITYTKGAGNMAIDDFIVTTGVLPITLSSFKGSFTNKTPVLNWIVTDQTGTNNFSIERSIDGKNFIEIDVVNATGEINYSYTDISWKNNINYYRLKINGVTTKYSSIVKVLSDASFTKLKVYPSPALHTINAEFVNERKQVANINILTFDGKSVFQKIELIEEGYNNLNFDIATISKGMYVLKITVGQKVISSVFSKQ
jgi:Secretion system C-terminal sorting domain